MTVLSAPKPGSWRRRVMVVVRACLLASLLVPYGYARVASGQEVQVTEYQLKAAFLYNFAKFIDWPADAFGGPSAPFTLCIIGAEPYLGAQQTLTGKTIKGKRIELRQVAGIADTQGCHMLFVGAQAGESMPALSGIGRYTLTVGETSGFAGHGGVINLTRVDDRVRFEIDRAAGERAGLKLSSQLLRLAILVGERP